MILDHKNSITECDVVLIGAGIMSATLGALLKELMPMLEVQTYERLDRIASESSDAWNNAGTGHSALCELNYTPIKNGEIDTSKAIKIMESFEISKQFWSYLAQKGYFSSPDTFINQVPHMSFVTGDEDVAFLKKRFEALQQNHLFANMEFSEDFDQIKSWLPLMMNERNPVEKIAATRSLSGTDVNFGELTRSMFNHLTAGYNTDVFLNHEVKKLKQLPDKTWKLEIKDLINNFEKVITAKFVFIGAGGGSLLLLEDADIPEADGYGGFPVSGQWLICKNEELIAKHDAKVYGKAKVGTPPMSVPHLDSRVINGKKELLFGPFAGFSTKFLKEGSYLDLLDSITFDNIRAMIGAGIHNLPLTKYLIQQVRMSHVDKVETLREFIPDAKNEDWELAVAGQRVQVIRKDDDEGGVLEFGTEVVTSKDGSIAALLGASPGASTAVTIMLELMSECFPEQMASADWKAKFKETIPSYEENLTKNKVLAKEMRDWTDAVLGLK